MDKQKALLLIKVALTAVEEKSNQYGILSWKWAEVLNAVFDAKKALRWLGCAAEERGAPAVQTGNSAMDAISALRDCVELVDSGLNFTDFGLSDSGRIKLDRAKDVLKLHQ